MRALDAATSDSKRKLSAGGPLICESTLSRFAGGVRRSALLVTASCYPGSRPWRISPLRVHHSVRRLPRSSNPPSAPAPMQPAWP